jgi:tRNA pseudouridine55 synthase
MRRPPAFPVDGVLLLDKPRGLTSNAALQTARRCLAACKAGHTGTLDPLASGLLPLTFGEATKFASDLLDADKAYEARLELGTVTSTGDAEGEVLERRPVEVDRRQFENVLSRFVGTIEQVPPMHSALKRDGRPLYELARAGQQVERRPRAVTIARLALIEWDARAPRVAVECSKGTYVRVLAEDIGRALGCGAHLAALCRTRVGALSLDRAVALAELEGESMQARRARLLPVDALLHALPRVELDDEQVIRFGHGQRVACADRAAQDAARTRVYDRRGRLLGVAARDGEWLAPRRLVAGPAENETSGAEEQGKQA